MLRVRTRKEKSTMRKSMGNKAAYLGAGAGIILFAIYGLLPGSFLGGTAGLGIAGSIFGTPVDPGIISRIIVTVFMLLGIMVSGLVFVTASSIAGWLLGSIVGFFSDNVKRLAPVHTRK